MPMNKDQSERVSGIYWNAICFLFSVLGGTINAEE